MTSALLLLYSCVVDLLIAVPVCQGACLTLKDYTILVLPQSEGRRLSWATFLWRRARASRPPSLGQTSKVAIWVRAVESIDTWRFRRCLFGGYNGGHIIRGYIDDQVGCFFDGYVCGAVIDGCIGSIVRRLYHQSLH